MSYNELVKGRIYFGGAADAEQAVLNDAVDVVVDVRVNGREEAVDYDYIHAPIAGESESFASSIKSGVLQIVDAYESGKKIYIHCGSGGGRAGVMAVATLLELDLAENLADAEMKAKTARPIINIRPNMKNALEELYK